MLQYVEFGMGWALVLTLAVNDNTFRGLCSLYWLERYIKNDGCRCGTTVFNNAAHYTGLEHQGLENKDVICVSIVRYIEYMNWTELQI